MMTEKSFIRLYNRDTHKIVKSISIPECQIIEQLEWVSHNVEMIRQQYPDYLIKVIIEKIWD